ncbi:2,3-diketo-5-methylthio-1-phosphopentane phosphatase [Ophiobolus disseminans]|uniref:2,3-diketo-5-methylthio-1-phosphopentane phosphatase n=1 Tax=Ophiobolus disseminans TaxID=1469910 RepID=A0A6A6ZZ29_9PLEO|nr:2,3-diketo-5-methylthio-1-phosphopentane phosphatase [Ophiobolus disseminans]
MSAASLDVARWRASEVVLLDIEGTISSISFVKDVMYPYALDRLRNLARDSWVDADFQHLIAGFPEDTKQDAESLVAHVEDLTRRDIKAVYLKQLQGYLWTTGFGNGDLKTPLFDEVVPTLQQWKATGKTLAIFSSGSVQAQLQFFSYVQDGQSTKDIKHLFSAHYDTVNAGPKLEKSSYEKICSELGVNVSKVTFLTDNVKEAEAATQANVYSVVVDRPGNALLSADSKATFAVIQKLTDLP